MKNILWTLVIAGAAAGSCLAQGITVNVAATTSTSQCTFNALSVRTGFTANVNFVNGGVSIHAPSESPITILKNADGCDAGLLKNLFSSSTNGIPTVTITLLSGTGQPAQTLQLSNAFVASLAGTSGGPSLDPLQENVTLLYETITISDLFAKTTVSCSFMTNVCR